MALEVCSVAEILPLVLGSWGQTHVALSYRRGVSRSSVTSFDAFDLSEFCLPDSADLFWTSAAVLQAGTNNIVGLNSCIR
jgi:hypothetical protein